ncbi:MAG: hypothetical protein R3D68_09980 [Hyphomicrobiaceae bacterium]
MAQEITLKHPQTGDTKKGFTGFSWTMLVFGGFVPLLRGDMIMALVAFVVQIATVGLGTAIWAFVFNKQYTMKLIEAGYEIVGDSDAVKQARDALGISA